MTPEKVKKVEREKPIPEEKKEIIKNFVENINKHRTVLIASCKGLPGKQFHEIKKKLRGKAEIKVAKKSAVNRAIDEIDKGAIKNLKKEVHADIVILFSDLDPFELSGILSENQSFRRARPGDKAPEDIEIEAGPTDLPPGPAISELGSVGLKVAVKEGKLEIMQGATVVKEGEEIKSNVASVLGKLDISPIKVGFLPLAAYDKQDDKVYVGIKIDKEGTLETLREMLGKALGFAVKVEYPAKETISYFIAKAAGEEKALEKILSEKSDSGEQPVIDGAQEKTSDEQASTESQDDTKEETKTEEEKIEEKQDDSNDNKDAKEESA